MLTVPTQDYRRSDYHVLPASLTGLDALVNSFIGRYRRRAEVLAGLKADADAILRQEREWTEVSDHVLHTRLMEFREKFRRGGAAVKEAVGPALAAIREAADRQLGMRPFGVQIIGALALHRGYLAEMATGEGKTLTAGLAAILAGWSRFPCHIVTVNDYLVQRDAEWMSPLYHCCGVRVGFVTGTAQGPERVKGYGCDVTYVTSKELLADFLRDRLRLGRLQDPTRRLIRRMLAPQAEAQDGLTLRGLHTAIVDEADSILIDEAVTPLIISASHKNESLRAVVRQAQEMISILEPEADYQTNPRYKEIELTKTGMRKLVDQAAHLPGIWRGHGRRLELVIQALVAREFFRRDRQYIVEGDKVLIVDEFTGRPMPQRTWREGLHQAVEAKEGLPISDPTETVARLSFQRFFRCFYKLSGMSGTAREAVGELWQVYGLPIVTIPRNRPCIRQQMPDRLFLDEAAKFQAIVADVQRLHPTGQPILVGTRSVQTSEKIWQMLAERGLEAKILNAARLKEEAAVVALAGEPGRITIATNMAGRGTDIKLGRGVTGLGGLHVIASERHESGRVDRQLFGRSARQGDPGSAQAFVSIEDELIQKYLSKTVRDALHWALRSDLPGKDRLVRTALALAQGKAQALAFKQRRNVLRSDVRMDEALSFAGVETI
jgi:preprotein translocase subunit SecA